MGKRLLILRNSFAHLHTFTPAHLLLLCLLTCSVAYADKYAAEFLNTGVGARALGMGGAFVALADDATAGSFAGLPHYSLSK